MLSRRAVLASLATSIAVSACASSPAPKSPVGPKTKSAEDKRAPVRLYHSLPEEAFWVSHGADHDEVISAGARLVTSPTGVVLKSAWDLELWKSNEVLQGALAVAPSLGGGYVHWSRTRVFRSKEFTGPLVPVLANGASLVQGIRGARNGIGAVLVLTENGPRELLPGSDKLTASRDAGFLDGLALDDHRAVKVDVFGHTSATADGGKTWRDLYPFLGASVRQLSASPDEIWVDTYYGRYALGFEGGKVTVPTQEGQYYAYRNYYDRSGGIQIQWKGTRATDRDDWPYGGGYRDQTPLQAAVASGVGLGDGSAIGVVQSGVVRVDLATGKQMAATSDWLPQGLVCDLVKVDDGILFACVYQRYGSQGGYVLRADGYRAPVVEKVFSDQASFITDGAGAFAFAGSCTAAPEALEIDTNNMRDVEPQQAEMKPVVCVRRGPGDWVEHTIDVDKDTSLVGWVPSKDGTVTALELPNDTLPAVSPKLVASGALPRSREENGVRMLRLYRDVDGWSWPRMSAGGGYGYGRYGGGQPGVVDRRYRAHDDGTIDGWMQQGSDPYGYSQVFVGATIGADGRTTAHELPPALVQLVMSGDYGLASTGDGTIYETTDHGKRWRDDGPSMLPPAAYTGACSALGCTLGGLVRLGWGPEPAGAVRIGKEAVPIVDKPALPRLVCSPRGTPEPLVSPIPPQSNPQRTQVGTAYGDTLDIVRDATLVDVSSQASQYGYNPPQVNAPVPAVPPSATPNAKKTPAPAVLKTQTLIFRPPLEPHAKLAKLNATDATISPNRREYAVPLLDAKNDVSLLIYGDTNELLVDRDKVTTIPAFDAQRYYYRGGDGTATGLALPNGHALLFRDSRQRSAIEEHGAKQPPPPLVVGADRNAMHRRQMVMARRDDGAAAVLVVDAGSPPSAGASIVDRRAGTTSALVALAPWSTVLPGDDPRCKNVGQGFRALLVIDPESLVELDTAALPGVVLNRQSLVLVHWGTERVCLEGLDASVADQRGRSYGGRAMSLVVRFDRPKDEAAALRSNAYREDLSCALEPFDPKKAEAR